MLKDERPRVKVAYFIQVALTGYKQSTPQYFHTAGCRYAEKMRGYSVSIHIQELIVKKVAH
jgi:hypothetical protein